MEPTLRGRTPHLLLYFPGYLAGCSLPLSASIPLVVPPAAAAPLLSFASLSPPFMIAKNRV